MGLEVLLRLCVDAGLVGGGGGYIIDRYPKPTPKKTKTLEIFQS